MVITHHLLSQIDETYDMQFENVELISEEFKSKLINNLLYM